MKVDKLNLTINDYYDIASDKTFDKYSIKSVIDTNLNNIKTQLNKYVASINDEIFDENVHHPNFRKFAPSFERFHCQARPGQRIIPYQAYLGQAYLGQVMLCVMSRAAQ